MFIGNGFLSGSIVHLPLDPIRYGIIGSVGIVIFMLSFVTNERKQSTASHNEFSLVRTIVFSLMLAIGIGMMSGGVQHFTDVPDYASKLIPAGIALSLLGYVFKNNLKLRPIQVAKLGGAASVAIIIAATTLGVYANSLSDSSSSHDDGHGSSTQEIAPRDDTPAPLPTNVDTHDEDSGHGH